MNVGGPCDSNKFSTQVPDDDDIDKTTVVLNLVLSTPDDDMNRTGMCC